LEEFGGGESAGRHHEHEASVAARRSLLPPPLWGRVGEGGGRLLMRVWRTPLPVPPPPGGGGRRGRGAFVAAASTRHLAPHVRHVALQDRRQIGIDYRGVAAADQLDQRRDLVADRHLGKAHLARE